MFISLYNSIWDGVFLLMSKVIQIMSFIIDQPIDDILPVCTVDVRSKMVHSLLLAVVEDPRFLNISSRTSQSLIEVDKAEIFR